MQELITTERGWVLNGDPLARICAECGGEFYYNPKHAISRFLGVRRDGTPADKGPRRYCSNRCAGLAISKTGIPGQATARLWKQFQATRTEKMCRACATTKPISEFRDKKQKRRYLYCRSCRATKSSVNYSTLRGYVATLISGARARAKKSGIPFDISSKWVLERLAGQDGRCWYSGVELTKGGGRRVVSPTNISLDRMDSSGGYTTDNVVLCAAALNIAKNIWTIDDLLGWADRIRAWRQSSNNLEIAS